MEGGSDLRESQGKEKEERRRERESVQAACRRVMAKEDKGRKAGKPHKERWEPSWAASDMCSFIVNIDLVLD